MHIQGQGSSSVGSGPKRSGSTDEMLSHLSILIRDAGLAPADDMAVRNTQNLFALTERVS